MLEIAEKEVQGSRTGLHNIETGKGDIEISFWGLCWGFYWRCSSGLDRRTACKQEKSGQQKDLQKKKRKNPAGTSYWRQNLIQVQPNVLCDQRDWALGRAFSDLIHKLRLFKHECQIQASPLAYHKKAEIKPRRKPFLFYCSGLTLVSCQTPTQPLLFPL